MGCGSSSEAGPAAGAGGAPLPGGAFIAVEVPLRNSVYSFGRDGKGKFSIAAVPVLEKVGVGALTSCRQNQEE